MMYIGMFQSDVCHLQLLDVDPNDQEEDGANIDLDSQRKGKCAVIKTSTRQVGLTYVLFNVYGHMTSPCTGITLSCCCFFFYCLDVF